MKGSTIFRDYYFSLTHSLDLSEMPTTPGIDITLPNPENIMLFNCIITPRDGLYQGAKFVFVVNIPLTYPYDPPKVNCETLVCTRFNIIINLQYSFSFRFTILISTGKATFALVSFLTKPNSVFIIYLHICFLESRD